MERFGREVIARYRREGSIAKPTVSPALAEGATRW
jgi:hypothetical protein